MKKLHLILLAVFSIVLVNVSAQSVTICNGKYSKKYHTSTDCRGLNNCKGGLSTVSLSEAVSMGRTPCLICQPATLGPTSNNNTTIKNSGVSVQCSAITKAGSRCKRMTKSSNGLCWQHGGN